MVDPNVGLTDAEVELYQTSRNRFLLWHCWLWSKLQPAGACRGELDRIESVMLHKLPKRSQLLRRPHQRPVQYFYFYNTAYTTFSAEGGDMCSGAALLANFAEVLGRMSECRQMFTDALPLPCRDEHEALYANVAASFRELSAAAESHVIAPFRPDN